MRAGWTVGRAGSNCAHVVLLACYSTAFANPSVQPCERVCRHLEREVAEWLAASCAIMLGTSACMLDHASDVLTTSACNIKQLAIYSRHDKTMRTLD